MTDGWRAEILDRLARSPCADRLRVFGSAADPAREPKDVDVFMEADFAAEGQALRPLLALAREFYGMFDPFVLDRGVLWTRSADATTWVRAKNARAIAAAGETGIPIEEAVAIAAARPTPTAPR